MGSGNVVHYTYDAASNLLTASDNFSTVTNTYDTRNRIQSTDITGTPGVPAVKLTYAYDAAGECHLRGRDHQRPGSRPDILRLRRARHDDPRHAERRGGNAEAGRLHL